MISFFFSSRRRHTRCLSDWSSDVCSSDLSRITTTLRSLTRTPTTLTTCTDVRSEEHTSELQSLRHLVCRLLLEKKKTTRLALRGSRKNGRDRAGVDPRATSLVPGIPAVSV